MNLNLDLNYAETIEEDSARRKVLEIVRKKEEMFRKKEEENDPSPVKLVRNLMMKEAGHYASAPAYLHDLGPETEPKRMLSSSSS